MASYESLLEDFDLIVGDSSDVWMFESPNVDAFDENWEGHMAITEDLEEVLTVVRPIPLNAELLADDGVTILEPANKYFVCQITPEESSRLESGIKYYFVVQIKNDTLGYKQELVQCRLKAKKQGIFR
jgi:hypothetical protein